MFCRLVFGSQFHLMWHGRYPILFVIYFHVVIFWRISTFLPILLGLESPENVSRSFLVTSCAFLGSLALGIIYSQKCRACDWLGADCSRRWSSLEICESSLDHWLFNIRSSSCTEHLLMTSTLLCRGFPDHEPRYVFAQRFCNGDSKADN